MPPTPKAVMVSTFTPGKPIARSIVEKLYPDLCDHDRPTENCATCTIDILTTRLAATEERAATTTELLTGALAEIGRLRLLVTEN